MDRTASITQNELHALLDYDPDTGIFIWKVSPSNNVPAGSVAGSKDKRGYVYFMVKGKRHRAHRLAWLYVKGTWPEQLDHENRIKFDNRIANLRETNSSQNGINCDLRSNNKSGHKGVCFNKRKNRWRAFIYSSVGYEDIGHYRNKEDAISARIGREIELFGEFSLHQSRS